MEYQLNNQQLLDEVEQNIVICLWRAYQLFAEAGSIINYLAKDQINYFAKANN